MQKVILIILLLIIPALVSAQSKSEAERLWELADKAYKESRFYDAIHYYEKALGYYPKDSLEAGGLYDEIGLCYMQLGDHAKAIKYFEISINITKKFNKIDYLSDVYDHIGQAYTALENFEKAKFYLEESLKIRKKLNDSFRLAETYNNLGLLYWRMEQHGKALSNYEEALKLLTNNNDYEQEMGYVLSNIGMVYLNLGLYEKAEKYLTESLRIREKYKNPQDLTIIYNNLGGLYSEIGNYDKSIYYYSRASEVSKKMGLLEDYGLNLMNLAAIYHSAGKYKEALKFYMESLKLFESINSIAYIVRNIENIAHIYLDLKDYKSAKFYFDKADKESFKISKRFDLGIIEFYIAIKDYSKALEILQKAPDDSIQSSLYKTQLYTQFGIVYLNTGNYINATESFLKAVNLAEEIRKKATERQNIFKSVIYKGLIRPYKGLVSALAEAYFKNYNYLPNFKNYGNTSASAAFYFSELTKARTLLEAMAGARKKIESPEIPQDLKEAENRILQELSYIDGRWEEAMKKGEQAVKELQARREGIKKQLDELIEV
ncbi:MAG: tetratricopeptide repeat protein, partial [Thermodesulfovibrio sp.]|nr:tetratricopeptide repeat protein [Thermodesulfovibrio sp.]